MNLVNFKKYKKSSAQQIYQLEEKAKKTVSSDTFKWEIDEIEKRLNDNFDVKTLHMQQQLINYKKELSENLQNFET